MTRVEKCFRIVRGESSCNEATVLSVIQKKKKEGVKELGGKKGIYVGESARSIFERAIEHRADRVSGKEDSHVIKHWLSSHQELKSPPRFKIEVLGSFQDAMLGR